MPALIPLFAAILPFVLWPVEIFFPYPHIAEELAKFVLVLKVPRSLPLSQKIWLSALIGIMFSFSESMLYTLNIYPGGNTNTLFLRLVLPALMHTLTPIIMLFFNLRGRSLSLLGLALSILIHFLFNKWIAI